MPKLAFSIPKYRRYRPKNLAVVNFGRGRDIYLGPWKSRRSRELYDQLVALWLHNGRALSNQDVSSFGIDAPAAPDDVGRTSAAVQTLTPLTTQITLRRLVDHYNEHARLYYRKNGKSTREAEQIAEALKVAVEMFGSDPADQFGPLRYIEVRDIMIQRGWSRGHINKQCSRIKRAFRWGVTREMVPSGVSGALREVEDLKKGRSLAVERPEVQPVSRETVNATLTHLNPVVGAMVRLQLATAARPGEIRDLRPCDVDRSGDVWRYTPTSHKTEHCGKPRVIFIGPVGQDILRPFLLRPAEDHCFSPQDAVRKVRAAREAARATPLSCGNRAGTNCKPNPQRTAGRKYTKDAYARAIRRASEAAGVVPWHPNQLRHTAATEIRAKHGLEATQCVLGHSRADVTQLYAERDQRRAADVIRLIG